MARPPFQLRFKRRLIRSTSLRFRMTILLGSTVLSGVVANKVLFSIGISRILVRYPTCVLISYVVFLGLVGIWLHFVLNRRSREANLALDRLDSIDLGPDLPIGLDSNSPTSFAGQGGKFGGGGASSSFGNPGRSEVSSAADIDDGIVLIAGIAVVVSIFASAIYLIIESPNVLSEAVFQAGLAMGMYKSARGMMGDHWLEGVLKKTAVPFLLVFAFAVLFGWVVHENCAPTMTRLSDYPEACAAHPKL